MNALTSIPQSQLLSIIPNGWEDALALAWKAERRNASIKQPRKRSAINAATADLRRRIVSVADHEMRPEWIAQRVGIKPKSIEYHLTALCHEERLVKCIHNGKAYYSAVSA